MNTTPSQLRITKQAMIFPIGVVLHFTGAVLASMLIGLILEGAFSGWLSSWLYGPWFDLFAPFITCTAFVGGFLVARKLRDRRACWAWVPGLFWFAIGAHELGFSLSQPHHISRVIDNLLGPADKCADSECFYEAFFTTPLFCSIAYSAASWLALRPMFLVPGGHEDAGPKPG